MIAAYMVAFAVLALVVVALGEARDVAWRRRLADAGRSRMAAPAQRERLRR